MTQEEIKNYAKMVFDIVEKIQEGLKMTVRESRDFYGQIKAMADGAEDGCDAAMDGE
jgi:hypothetical protein